MDEPDETANAMDLFLALGTKDFERNFQRLTRDPRGRALLVERPDLLAKLSDRESLAALPEGSLGRACLEYLERYGFDPTHLIELQHRVADRWEAEEGAPPLDDMRSWYRDRALLLHDVFHVLTGYGADQLGEATLLGFTQGQLGGRVNRLLTIGASFEVMQAMGTRWLPYVFCAWRRGRRAVALHALRFEELMPRPLDEVRRLARIEAPELAHPDGVLQGSVSEIRAH
jgi:ubiquinone biosynthesis protein COQ4